MSAARVLWAWGVWTVAYGIYQTWFADAAAVQPLLDQFAPGSAVPSRSLQGLTAAAYALMALSIAWLAVKIGDGKRWARNSVLASFALQALWVSGSSGTADILSNVPDLGLQLVALWFLYTKPARAWFIQQSAPKARKTA